MSELKEAPQAVEPFPLSTLRHSVAHLMASAVAKLFPEVKFGFGPSIEHGFYYDFDLVEPLTDKDLKRIEKEMRRIARKTPELVRHEVSREEAREQLAGQDYKLEALELIPEDEQLSFYAHGDWQDLCQGPHIDTLDRDYAFKLQSIAGAYWRGDEANPMLQRIYGTAFWNKEALTAHMEWLKEVQLRDHRKLGVEMDLFSHHAEAGSGFIFWHPDLGCVRREIENFWWDLHTRAGYKPVYTPLISRESLFAVSGHLENYSEMMYAPMDIDEMPYRVKPMNCPGHILIYKNRGRSYRELPLRWAELGTVHRYERSGTIHGMLRVRGFTQDDAHIFCTPDQLADEIAGVCSLVHQILTGFGFEYTAYLATRPEKDTIGEAESWERATAALKDAAKMQKLPLVLDEGGGAFYGPKIDYKIKDALGREWQNSTIQCDFNLPERFDLTYVDSDGKKKRPILVHRAILGSLERFVGVLIEHFGGKFPLWCAPTQVAVIPIREEHGEYCRGLAERLEQELLRVDCMSQEAHMNKKIKEAQARQVPFMLIAGERECSDGSVALRRRGTREQEVMAFDDFLELVLKLRASRSLELV
ncbi:MAG: threonine--tRNA ligase [bacterium]|jgi:threonyl-tRNA synthetase|nr:threonine--tRNA ligase [Planctomycetota bacterium]HIL52048.1 threonine--tRNA ligase [Planctomycetota bacterium]